MARLPRYRPTSKRTIYKCRLGRITDAYPKIGPAGKRELLNLLDSASRFYGFELLAYAITAREMECVVRFPGGKATESEAIDRIASYYGADAARRVAQGAADKLSAQYLNRALAHFGDLAMFIKRVKGPFSRYYSERQAASRPSSPVWHDRYRAEVVQDSARVILTACAEVELRPYWDGDRRPPARNPFCSFGAASVGDAHRRNTICQLAGESRWSRAAAAYQQHLDTVPPPPQGRGSHGRKGVIGDLSLEKLVNSRANRSRSQLGGSRDDLTPESQHLADLSSFRKRFGHTRVPVEWEENPALGSWFHARRSLHRRGKLSAGSIQKLDALGFDWQLPRGRSPSFDKISSKLQPELYASDAAWLKFRRQLHDFIDRHGHAAVPTDAQHLPLYRWMVRQRAQRKKKRLGTEKRRLLDEIGFPWKSRKRKQR